MEVFIANVKFKNSHLKRCNDLKITLLNWPFHTAETVQNNYLHGVSKILNAIYTLLKISGIFLKHCCTSEIPPGMWASKDDKVLVQVLQSVISF